MPWGQVIYNCSDCYFCGRFSSLTRCYSVRPIKRSHSLAGLRSLGFQIYGVNRSDFHVVATRRHFGSLYGHCSGFTIVQRPAWGAPFECVAPVQAIAVSEYTLFVPCQHQRVAVSIFSEIGFGRSIRTSFAPHKADFASCLGMGHVLDGKYMDHGPRHFVQFSAKRSRFW